MLMRRQNLMSETTKLIPTSFLAKQGRSLNTDVRCTLHKPCDCYTWDPGTKSNSFSGSEKDIM